jgi:hypothetical protein
MATKGSAMGWFSCPSPVTKSYNFKFAFISHACRDSLRQREPRNHSQCYIEEDNKALFYALFSLSKSHLTISKNNEGKKHKSYKQSPSENKRVKSQIFNYLFVPHLSHSKPQCLIKPLPVRGAEDIGKKPLTLTSQVGLFLKWIPKLKEWEISLLPWHDSFLILFYEASPFIEISFAL